MAERIPCPQPGCDHTGKTKAAVGGHLREHHGIPGGLSGRVNGPQPRRRRPKAPARSLALVPTTNGATNGATVRTFRVLPFVVLEDDEGSIYMAEKLRDGRD